MNGEESLRLTRAAIAARDDLRSVILPGLDRLAKRATQPETRALIETLHGAAWKHLDALRLAMKDRTPTTRQRADLPCWSTQQRRAE